jgi:hypothetical protein
LPDVSLTHQLSARVACCDRERERPEVLVHDEEAEAVRLERSPGRGHVFVGEQARRSALERPQITDLVRIEIRRRQRLDLALDRLDQHDRVEDADQPLVDEVEQRWNELAVDLSVRRFDQQPVDRAGLAQVRHRLLL